MIDLDSIRGLHDHDHFVAVHCLSCARWAELDLARLIRVGQGYRRLPMTVSCRRCGEVGSTQIRPPQPTRILAGWIAPPVR